VIVAPKAGRRGDVALPLLERTAPFRCEHERSVRQHATPRTWEALAAFFREAWEASLPTRLHTSGVEDESALGSPRMAGAMHQRIDHASTLGWGLTGWDQHGQPRGVNRSDGLSRDPFLYWLERMLRSLNAGEALGARALVRWAYMGWDWEAAAQETFCLQHADPATWPMYHAAYHALLERTIRTLWIRCQREPERWNICKDCRHRDCICGQRSDSQVNAEGDVAREA
jgi:hypothetical protein